MHLSATILGIVIISSAVVLLGDGDAAACGGCFHPPTQTASDITDERMLLSVSPTQTTLYDQIRYAGSPSSFAWVLPIHGTVTVGLSADILFDAVDSLTATRIVAPPSSCPPPPTCSSGCGAASESASAFSAAPNDNGGAVNVVKQENVGPYATAQLHATDSSALSDWLAQNGFAIPAAVAPVIEAYVLEGFDFLAMKLLPDEGVNAMRPVRVSSPGASLSLPLRMAAVGTGVSVGITVWVVADGRYEPQNFPFFRIADDALIWDWPTSASNYATLRAQNEALLAGAGWEIESSLTINQQLVSSLILSGGLSTTAGPADPSEDYLAVLASSADGGPDSGPSTAVVQSADDVRTADIATLFAGITPPNARITRFRGDIAHAAMTADLVLQASVDQSELPNLRTVTKSINETCSLYSGCDVVGSGTPAQAAAQENKSSCAASAQSIASTSTRSGSVAALITFLLARTVLARKRRRTRI